MLKEIKKNIVTGALKLKGSELIYKKDIQEKIKEEILHFILNNKDKVEKILPNKIINKDIIGILYLRLPFPIKILLSEEAFVKLILDGDSIIKETLSNMGPDSEKEKNIENENEIDENESSLIGKTKDTILAHGAKVAINHQIRKYGKMINLDLNTTNKSINLEVILEGEYEPLSLFVKNYEIIQQDDEYFLKIYNIVTSRTWIDIAIVPRLEGKSISIPSKYAKVISKIV